MLGEGGRECNIYNNNSHNTTNRKILTVIVRVVEKTIIIIAIMVIIVVLMTIIIVVIVFVRMSQACRPGVGGLQAQGLRVINSTSAFSSDTSAAASS